MAQFLRPDENVTQTNFTGGFADIDESSPSDADFAWGTNNTVAVLEVALSAPADIPGAGTCTVRHRLAKTNAGVLSDTGNSLTVTGEIFQGTTQIVADSARTVNGTWTTYEFTFAASAVSDWSNLRLRETTTASGGSPANRRGGAVSWAEVEVPDAAAFPPEHDDAPAVGGDHCVGLRAALAAGLVLAAGMATQARSFQFADDIVPQPPSIAFEDDQGPRVARMGREPSIQLQASSGLAVVPPAAELAFEEDAPPLYRPEWVWKNSTTLLWVGDDELPAPAAPIIDDSDRNVSWQRIGPAPRVRIVSPSAGSVPEVVSGPIDELYWESPAALIAARDAVPDITILMDGSDALPLLFIDGDEEYQHPLPKMVSSHKVPTLWYGENEVPVQPTSARDEDYWQQLVRPATPHKVVPLWYGDEEVVTAPTGIVDESEVPAKRTRMGSGPRTFLLASNGGVAPEPVVLTVDEEYNILPLVGERGLGSRFAVPSIVGDDDFVPPPVVAVVDDDTGLWPLQLSPNKQVALAPWVFEQHDTFGLTVEETYQHPFTKMVTDHKVPQVWYGDEEKVPTLSVDEEAQKPGQFSQPQFAKALFWDDGSFVAPAAGTVVEDEYQWIGNKLQITQKVTRFQSLPLWEAALGEEFTPPAAVTRRIFIIS